MSPDQVKPQQPDPMKVAEMQLLEREVKVKEGNLALMARKMGYDFEIAKDGIQLKLMTAKSDHAIKADEQDRKDRELDHRIDIDNQELEIERNADEIKGIAAVNN